MLQIGDSVLTESAAIAIYLAERYGSSRLIPAEDSPDRGQFLRWCFFAMMELDAHTMYVLRKHVALVDIYGEAPAAVRTAQEGYQRQIRVVADAFADNRPYILGDRFTVADILLVTCIMDDPAGIGVVMDIPGSVLDYARRLKQRKAFTQALEVNRG